MGTFRTIAKKILLNEIVLAIIFALLLKAYIMDSRYVPSSSMHPTLQVNDRLLVNKLSYKFGEMQRGDIIIFQPPPSVESEYDYVKRLIAMPGDIVEVKSGILYVNGEPQEEDYINEIPNYEFPATQVPDNSLFVMGDNRNYSFDSHLWVDWLPIGDVKGKVFYRYWPISRIGTVQ